MAIIQQKLAIFKKNLYEFTKNERMQYSNIFDIIDIYVIEHNLLISNPYKLTSMNASIESWLDFHYSIYCSNPLMHANELINLIYEELLATKNPMINLLVMNTTVKEEEYAISHDNRFVVKIYALQRNRPKGHSMDFAKLIEPVIINKIPYMPAEIEIIDVYNNMYTNATNLDILTHFENYMLTAVVGKIGGQIYALDSNNLNPNSNNPIYNENDTHFQDSNNSFLDSNNLNPNSNNPIYNENDTHFQDSNQDENVIDFGIDAVEEIIEDLLESSIIGAGYASKSHSPKTHDTLTVKKYGLPCYEKKKDELEAIKLEIVKNFFVKRLDIALVGPLAVEWYKTSNQLCPKYDRIQMVGQISVDLLKTQLESYLESFGKKYTISMGDYLDLLIPKDFRTKRKVFSICMQTDVGIKEKPFLEYFNSCEFELVPVFESNGILVANKYVLLKFLFIDLWVTKFIHSIGKLDNATYVIKQQRAIEAIRNAAKIPFVADGTIGTYYDYEISKKEKKINQEQHFWPYYPSAYFGKHGKLRIL